MISISDVLSVALSGWAAIPIPIILCLAAFYLGAALGMRHLAWALICIAGVWFFSGVFYREGVEHERAANERAATAERQRQDAETALALASDRERARLEADQNRATADLAGKIEADQEAQARLDAAAASASRSAVPAAPLVTKAIHDQLEAIR